MPVASRSSSRRSQRGVAMIWYTLMITTVLLPLLGIAVDMTMLYTVQAKLAAAADGAALGAGRLLGTATGKSAAPTEAMAGEFFKANFPPGYWSSPALSATTDPNNTTPNTYYVKYTNPAPGSFQIAVKGNVQVPLIFARIFNVNNAAVSTAAVATRRSSRIIYVLDRSGSMNTTVGGASKTTWESVRDSAILYAGWASPGVDELGLVIFGSTAVVAYPNYTKTVASPYQGYITSPDRGLVGGVSNVPIVLPAAGPSGPDPQFIDLVADSNRDGTTSCSDMLCMAYQGIAGGATGMSEALDLAYLELQKAHLRDWTMDGGNDARMNTVIFLTDGVPNQITAYANDPNATQANGTTKTWLLPACTTNWSTQTNCITNWKSSYCSGCTNCKAATDFANPGDNRMLFMTGPGQNAGSGGFVGPYQLADTDTASTTLQWVKETNPSGNGEIVVNTGTWTAAPISCSAAQIPAESSATISPWHTMAQFPKYDYYGTLTYPRNVASPGYYSSTLSTSLVPHTPWLSTPAATQQSTGTSYWGLAAWSTTDNIGYNMRTDSNQAGRGDGGSLIDPDRHMTITIYTIGYTGNGGTDDGLLKRLANTVDSTSYDSTQPVGQYYPASNADGIAKAMATIMSSVLRLAQ